MIFNEFQFLVLRIDGMVVVIKNPTGSEQNHAKSPQVYDEAQKISPDDWEIWHNKGLCYMYLRQYDSSIDCFTKAGHWMEMEYDVK
jgi:tetratricopeptide (TPR) repeat protein